METGKITLIPAQKDYITNAVISRIPRMAAAQVKLFDNVIGRVTELLNHRWVKFEDRGIWFNTSVSGIFPDLDKFEPSKQNVFFSFVESKFHKSFAGFEGNLMTLTELRASGIYNLLRFERSLFAYKEGGLVKAVDISENVTYSFNTAAHREAVCIPSVRFTKKNGLPLAGEEVIMVFLDKGLIPSELSSKEADSFSDLINLYKADKGYVGMSSDGHITFDTEKLSKDITSGEFSGSINGLDFSMDTLLSVTRIKADEEFTHALKVSLLNCEKRRADIDPYDEKLLSDPGRGHWDLWDGMAAENGYAIEISEPLIARNPVYDINRDGVIAIDFGTKSTVVVYQKSSDHTLPMAIGTGRLSDAGLAEHYENPTVMEFVDMQSFLAKYRSILSRPETRWADLPVSHTAFSDMKHSAGKDYYSFFSGLKQWAGEGSVPLRICDRSGAEYLLPPFMDEETGDFDPIEIYAYYIGLYINNMRNGIFLDYYLSFPVTFEKSVREKIAQSFERGIMRSLPSAVTENEELMADFRVDGTISEPAAYAVCAMESYNIFPDRSEDLHYGIFDFGGGTTDFDFGVCRVSDKRKFDYCIENHGAGGDKYLGGENLLARLAVTVFRDNYDVISHKGITFTLPVGCKEFAGAAAVVARSGEAEANMRHMMEALRPLWEETGENREGFERGVICVDLYDKNGGLIPRLELNVNEEKLISMIESEISGGIDNFFTSMALSYTSAGVELPRRIAIMLAGNSCKSSAVSRIFEEKFESGAQKLAETAGLTGEIIFELYPPLGTEASYTLMEQMGVEPHRNSVEYPTGKTGVAFGLIKCRKGGVIERTARSAKEDEIPFKYFIGRSRRGRFEVLNDGTPMTLSGRPDYNIWYNFTDADEDTFEIFYTSLPEAVSGELPISRVMKKKCRINVVYEKAYVYVRATGPRTLQYVAATENGINFETYLSKIVTVEL